MQRKPTTSNVDDFIHQAKDQGAKKTAKEDTTGLDRKTSYLRPDQIKAIKRMAFFEDMGESEIVRNALDQYIPAKYLKDNM